MYLATSVHRNRRTNGSSDLPSKRTTITKKQFTNCGEKSAT